METRLLGKTGVPVGVVGFGAWAIGGTWGTVDDAESLAALHAAVDAGSTLIDTADVYGDGRSERLVGQLLRERSERLFVATKAGRRLSPHHADGYTAEKLSAFVERSLTNLRVERLDLLQLHCPPTEVYYRPELFGALDELVSAGKLAHYGVSVEKVEEAIKAVEYAGVSSVQIIYNLLRQRPAERFFALAKERNVGILVRLPLSSGVLTGKLRRDSVFESDDHRAFNREGAAFDKGETFSGVPYEAALDFVEALRPLVPAGWSMVELALRWILMEDAVSCVIPGAKRAEQATANARAGSLPPLPPELMAATRELYERRIKALVHQRW